MHTSLNLDPWKLTLITLVPAPGSTVYTPLPSVRDRRLCQWASVQTPRGSTGPSHPPCVAFG